MIEEAKAAARSKVLSDRLEKLIYNLLRMKVIAAGPDAQKAQAGLITQATLHATHEWLAPVLKERNDLREVLAELTEATTALMSSGKTMLYNFKGPKSDEIYEDCEQIATEVTMLTQYHQDLKRHGAALAAAEKLLNPIDAEDKFQATQRQFDEENEHDEREDR